MESTEGPETTVSGFSRRQALKKGAIAGGAVIWATPVVQNIGLGRAFAQQASPGPVRGVSYIQFRFQCGSDTFFAHVDSLGSANKCDAGAGANACLNPAAGDASGCGRFTLDVQRSGNEVSSVTITLDSGCAFIEGYSKCGPDCEAAVAAPGGGGATFSGCPQ